MKKIITLIFVLFFAVFSLQAQTKKIAAKKKTSIQQSSIKKIQDVHIKIITDSGIIIVKLCDSTPTYRDNFIKLVQQGFYDSLLFHRVIPNFMIQGGDPTSKNAQPGMLLGNGGDSLPLIPADFKPYLFHKRGVLAAARDGDDVDPTKASSACQFYIVTGQKFTDDQLNQMELKMNKVFTPEQREAYKTVGGAPWLDNAYTIFGEVESGMEVVDKIAAMPRDGNDRPLTDIRMKMEIMK
jgi:cyclophilin family peptidyl-prolyl cis-trans isomerase